MSEVDHPRRATVRIVAANESEGTGFFVAPDVIATCGHVAGPQGDHVAVHCADNAVLRGTVAAHNADEDVALIEVPTANYPPLPLDDTDDDHRGKRWLAYGFPRIAKSAAVLIEGPVRLIGTRDSKGRAALQLFSEDTAAGRGARLEGFSGSAVIARGRVIGQLRTTPKDLEGNAQLGLIFAAPSAAIIAMVRGLRPGFAPRPTRAPQPANAPYDPAWYVPRTREETRAAEDLDARKPVVLTGPQFFGKSSLMTRILESARNRERQRGRDARIAEIDLGGLDVLPSTELRTFFPVFFEAILRSLDLTPAGYLDRYLGNHGMTGPSALALLKDLLEHSDNPLYLVLSQAEALIDWQQLDAFASWLRGLPNKFSKLRLLAEFCTAPALVTARMPSFNIAPEQIVVRDFDRDQVVELAALYGLPWTDAEIDALRGLVGGHPYLLRRAMFEAAKARTALSTIIERAQDDDGVYGDFLHDNFARIHRTESLREAACSIACGRPPPSHPPDAVDKLLAAGIIRRGKTLRELSPAYPLYRSHLREMCQS